MIGPYRHELFPIEKRNLHFLLPILSEVKNVGGLKWIVCNKKNPTEMDAITLIEASTARVAATLDRSTGWISTAYFLHNFTGKRAQFHFIGRPAIRGKKMREAGRDGLAQLFRYFNLETLWSEVPITNRLVLKLARDVGFSEKTVLTNAFNIVNTQTDRFDIVDGVIIQLNRDELRG